MESFFTVIDPIKEKAPFLREIKFVVVFYTRIMCKFVETIFKTSKSPCKRMKTNFKKKRYQTFLKYTGFWKHFDGDCGLPAISIFEDLWRDPENWILLR